ncbi:hypothetical protein [Chryseobacterium oryctis]|uniref:PrcB C-terminal n=1 Tax=Chryseobacterium oryctis TaxID=2952618 RepID=A0ABT3HNM1_9FLAO|nr:hypothetical protein [Chryseobacterium oryctis]MCW3161333.1 hypothetical protein [Chryseobacterium oryctis]
MKSLFILCFAIMMSCTTAPSQKSSEMQQKTEILASESQGGTGKVGFTILSNEQDFQKALKGNGLNNLIVEVGARADSKPALKFPKDKKVVLYNLGTFRSGDHTIREIKNTYVKDNILYVEIPYVERSEMEIQVISNPYVIFTVPSTYNFTSIEFKSLK